MGPKLSFQETKIEAKGVRSLVWAGNDLVDWVGGGERFQLDGTTVSSNRRYAYRFDAAVGSADGEFAVIYERLGTKGVVLRNGEVVREINRSYYQAEAYEYPLCLLQLPDGVPGIVHCPDEYNQLEIEELVSGQRRTQSKSREPCDFFHSRLTTNPSGTHFMSAGWVWHPFDVVGVFSLEQALEKPSSLDTALESADFDVEAHCAGFLSDQKLVVCNGDEPSKDQDDEMGAGALGVWNLDTEAWESVSHPEEFAGTMMPLDERLVVGFFDHPKVFDLESGNVIQDWPSLATGHQSSSIIRNLDPLPPVALDPKNRRFAVANEEAITVVSIDI